MIAENSRVFLELETREFYYFEKLTGETDMLRENYLLQNEVEKITGMCSITINKYLKNREVSKFPLPVRATKNVKIFSKEEVIEWVAKHQNRVQKLYQNNSKSSKEKKDIYIMNLLNSIEENHENQQHQDLLRN